MSKYKIVVTDAMGHEYETEQSVFHGMDIDFCVCSSNNQEALVKCCEDADGILCNLAPMPKDVIRRLKKCRVISRYGIGYDNVDIDACTESGIWVANVRDYCLHEVAEHAISLLLSCARSICYKNKHIRGGVWDTERNDQAFRFFGKTLSFIGFGSIARTMMRKLSGFGLNVLVYDPFVEVEAIENEGALKVIWDDAIRNADYISVHMPCNDSTRGIIDEKAFAMMKPGAVLVNTSRGGVIDEEALITALKNRTIHGAGLDVFANEPLPDNSPLLSLDNCVLTDHAAWFSSESVQELKTKCAENIRAVLVGGDPLYPVNDPFEDE